MEGQVVFRFAKSNNFLNLKRHLFIHQSETKSCFTCSAFSTEGEVDILNQKTFQCRHCVDQYYTPVLNAEHVIEHHYVQAVFLFSAAYHKFQALQDELWFWMGRKWHILHGKEPIDVEYVLRGKGISFYLGVRRRALQSVDMLCLCLMRLEIYKDLRQFIVKLIWPAQIIAWLK